MCGIAGIFDRRCAGRVERHHLLSMTDALMHRGPDDSGCHLEPNLGLGFRRLAIVDLADGLFLFASEIKGLLKHPSIGKGERYSTPGFHLNVPYEDDLLMIVLSFGVFMEEFAMPRF